MNEQLSPAFQGIVNQWAALFKIPAAVSRRQEMTGTKQEAAQTVSGESQAAPILKTD